MKFHISFLLVFILLIAIINTGICQTPGTEKWAYTTGGDVFSSPAIGADGTIYVGSYDNKLYALNPDGSLKWSYTTSGDVGSSPAIGADGTIYVGSDDNKLYAINPDGSLKWSYTTAGDIESSPAIGADGTIYVGSYDDKLYAINSDGSLKWSFLTLDYIRSSPAISNEGTIYVASYDNRLYAINPDGTQKWSYTTGDNIWSSPAIDADGVIYVGSYDNKLYAINSDGSLKWTFETEGMVYSSPAIDVNGTIYASGHSQKLYAINKDGTQKWVLNMGTVVYSPSIGNDGTIYVGSFSNNAFYAINSDGSIKWSFGTGGSVFSSPVIDENGIIYVGSHDNKLYAIYSSSMGLAQTPWPKFHQNNQNTGRAGSTVYLSLVDKLQFALFNYGETFQKEFEVGNASSKNMNLYSCVFGNPLFSLNTTLPMTISAGTIEKLTATIQPDSTGLYESTCNLIYEADGDTNTTLGNVKAGLFLNDGSELSYAAARSIEAYNNCLAEDASSIATINNKGVLYRLLSEIDIAEQMLINALSRGLNANYGYSGIKMNVGVVKSDQGQSTDAHSFYDVAMNDVLTEIDSSVIAPEVYYNISWENYVNSELSNALSNVNETISHIKVNDYLKAKAYVLRGAIYFRRGDNNSASSDFQQAINLDPGGPIGHMAEENLQIITGVEDNNVILPTMFVLKPNYPNPFNSETMISFGLPKSSKIILEIYNVLGQKVKTLLNTTYEKGWHNLRWSGTNDNGNQVSSGLYLLRMRADEFTSTVKMILMK